MRRWIIRSGLTHGEGAYLAVVPNEHGHTTWSTSQRKAYQFAKHGAAVAIAMMLHPLVRVVSIYTREGEKR